MLYISSRHDGIRLPGDARRQHVGLRRRHGRRHRHRLRPRRAICTSATAAAPSSRSAPTARSTSSPRWSLPSPPIIWPSARTAISTSPAPRLPASMPCIAFRTHGEVEVFYRGLGRPQGMAFDEDGRLYVAASLGGRRGMVRIDAATARPSCSSPAPASSAWPSRLRAPWSWPPPTRSIASTSASRAGRSSAHRMNAEIIAVGSEMLTPQRVDTNSLYLTGRAEQPRRRGGRPSA